MARQDYEGAPISGVTGNVAGSTTSDAGSSQSRGFTDPGSQGENTVIQPTRFNLNNNPNSTTITRSPLQQFRFNRDAERASRVVSYTPANIAEFEAATGRTRTNPYGPNGITGMAQKIFGVENVQLDPEKQAEYNAIYDLNLDKFMNPDLQSKIGLRGMVGDPVTGGNTIAKQVTPMSTSEMGARLFTGLATPLGPILSVLPGNNVSYVSTGNEEVYDPQLDPNVNPDLSSGIMGNLMKTFSGGTDLQEAGGRVMDLGRKGLDSLTERFGANDLEVPAGVMGNLERPMDKYAGQGGRDLLAAQITPAAPTADYDTIAAGGRDDVRMKAAPFSLPISSSEPYEIQSSPMLDQTTPSPDIRFPDDPSRQTVYEAMLNPDYQSGRHSIALPNGAVAELINGRFTGARRGLTP